MHILVDFPEARSRACYFLFSIILLWEEVWRGGNIERINRVEKESLLKKEVATLLSA